MPKLSTYLAAVESLATRLELPLSQYTWQGQAGNHQGSGTGASMDFQDHRDYAPGDDPRHIDWNAYARSGNYTMKLFREEVQPAIDILFDASPSMFLDEHKKARSSELLFLIHNIAQRSGAATKTYLVSDAGIEALSSEALYDGKWMDTIEKAKVRTTAPELSRVPYQKRSLRVFISDLLYPGSPEATLKQLQSRDGRPLILCPFSRAESSPEWSGNCDFVDVEAQSSHQYQIDASALKRYTSAYLNHFELWASTCRSYRTLLARVSSSDSLLDALREQAIPSQALILTNR